MLGLIIDTNTFTVGIPPDYVKKVLNLINTTWHLHRRCFTVGEAQRLTGKLGHLVEGAQWVFHLLTHLSPCWSDRRVTIVTLGCRTLEHLKRSEK